MSMYQECKQGLDIMKYSLNHKHEFDNPYIAFAIGFMQFSMVICVELACILVTSAQNQIS